MTRSIDRLKVFRSRCGVLHKRRGVRPDIWNQLLYDMCLRYPGHDDQEAMMAKVGIISRSYAAQVERGVTKSDDQPSALGIIVGHLWKHRRRLQRIFNSLDSLTEPLTASNAEGIIAEHGRFVELLSGVTRFEVVSFASKYMHFHCPVVPILDSRASAALRSLVPWRSVTPPFEFRPPANQKYYQFVLRFLRTYDYVRHEHKDATVKFLDSCLMDYVRSRKANLATQTTS